MEPTSCWALFCATGDPLAYMLYRAAEKPVEDPAKEPPQEDQR